MFWFGTILLILGTIFGIIDAITTATANQQPQPLTDENAIALAATVIAFCAVAATAKYLYKN